MFYGSEAWKYSVYYCWLFHYYDFPWSRVFNLMMNFFPLLRVILRSNLYSPKNMVHIFGKLYQDNNRNMKACFLCHSCWEPLTFHTSDLLNESVSFLSSLGVMVHGDAMNAGLSVRLWERGRNVRSLIFVHSWPEGRELRWRLRSAIKQRRRVADFHSRYHDVAAVWQPGDSSYGIFFLLRVTDCRALDLQNSCTMRGLMKSKQNPHFWH